MKAAYPAVMTKQIPPGAPVRVKRMSPPGHVRCPWYLRGKAGVIERDLGLTGDPEALAYDAPHEPIRLYRVRFQMAEIWGRGAEGDTLDAEIFENWLEVSDAA
ncbi:MAG: SH3-like domain-containing protein [Pseudomonadota bacterium]